ncbi:MAG TPA: site-specific integrase [Burkholderiales bacterium]|nr:site-specific integrase [Burkholderiales bacterium]
MGALRKQMDADMVVRGMSVRTRESYLAAVAGLAKYYGRSPEQVSEAEVQRYLLHLIEERKLAWSSCNIAVSGLRFVYHITLKRTEAQFAIPRARQPQKLPQILSREEIARLIELTANPKHRALLMSAYGAGLRLSELCRLKVGDIDSQRMSIRVEQGKGAKDRYTLLSARLLAELRRYWIAYRPKLWLFTGTRDRERPISDHSVQRLFYAAKARAGITKECGIHGLRHAFATHLLEAGVDVHTIQRLLGHGHISSTLRYFHLADKHLAATASPLDLLDRPDTARF